MAESWTRQEPGWYTHPKLGGICRERKGAWYWHPGDQPDEIRTRKGPVSSLNKAIALADHRKTAGFQTVGRKD